MMWSITVCITLISLGLVRALKINPTGIRPSALRQSKKSVQELKDELKGLCVGTKNGLVASPELRVKISTLVSEIERNCPTKKMTKSPLLTGSWKLIYTTNEGSSAGKLGPFVGDVEQAITPTDYVNFVKLPFLTAFLKADWDVLSDTVWRVNFRTITFQLFGITVSEKPLVATGIWRKTYVDESLRVLYAAGNTISQGQLKENIYILSK